MEEDRGDIAAVSEGVSELRGMAQFHGEVRSAEQEDLMLQARLLQSRLNEERILRGKLEDDSSYLRHQLKLRDKKIDHMEAEAAKVQTRIEQLQRLVDDKDKAALAQKQANLDLRNQMDGYKSKILELQREVRAIHFTTAATTTTTTTTAGGACSLVPDRRFEEAFHDKVAIIRLGKKVRRHFETREHAMQALERNAMEAEDARSQLANDLGFIDRVPARADEAAEGDDSGRPRRLHGGSSLLSFETVKRHGRGHGALPYKEALDLRTPQDVFVDAKLQVSAFGQPLTNLRQSLKKLAHEVKEGHDKALTSLYYIFDDHSKKGKGLLANPREDFERELRNAIVTLRRKLQEMVQVLHAHTLQVINDEKPTRLRWAAEARTAVHHVGCQVDIPPPEDPRIAQLREQLEFVTNRADTARTEFTGKLSNLELLKDKSEVNTQFIQQKIFELHDGMYQALHSVWRHRFHWVSRFSNSFQGIDRSAAKSTALAVAFNVKVGQAVDEDLHYLRKLADYFVSDDLFGSDLAAVRPGAGDEGGASSAAGGSGGTDGKGAYLVAKRKEAMPTRRKIDQARRLSGQMETLLREELRGETFGKQQQEHHQQQQPTSSSSSSMPIVPSAAATSYSAPSSRAASPSFALGCGKSNNAAGVPSGQFALFQFIDVVDTASSKDPSASSTPVAGAFADLGGSLRDEITIPTKESFDGVPVKAIPFLQRSARSANSSPDPRGASRPHTARSRSGSASSQVFVPSRPPLTRKASGEDLRRVNSLTSLRRSSTSGPGEPLACAKVTIQLDRDVTHVASSAAAMQHMGGEVENEESALNIGKLGATVTKSFGSRRQVNV